MTNSHRLLPIHPSVFLGEGAKNFFSSCCFLWYGFTFDIYSAWFTWEICTVTQSLFQFTNRWLCPGRARHTEPVPLSTATHSGTQSQKVWPPANQEFFIFFLQGMRGKWVPVFGQMFRDGWYLPVRTRGAKAMPCVMTPKQNWASRPAGRCWQILVAT